MAELVITAENAAEMCGAGQETFEWGGHRRILNANPMFAHQDGRLMFAKPAADFELIPREQWPDLISQKDREKSWLKNICDDLNIPVKDQDGLGYCWVYGNGAALEVLRAVHGLPYIELAPESVGGPINGWRNEGGMPDEALEYIVQNGMCPQSYLDRANSLSPSRWKDGWKAAALLFRAVEYIGSVASKLWDFACTCALRNIPTVPWFNWWSHCISGSYQLRVTSGGIIEILNRNNWGKGWGDNGYGWFREGSGNGGGTPSGICAPRVVMPTEAEVQQYAMLAQAT